MGKKISIIVLGLILALALVFGGWGCAEKPPAEAIKWKFQSLASPKGPVHGYFSIKFAELVNQNSGGRLEMELFIRDAIVTKKEAFEAVQRGIVDAVLTNAVNYAPVMPEGDVEFGFPMEFQSIDVAYDFYYKYKDGAFVKLLDEVYRENGIHLLALSTYTNGFLLKFPMNKAEDLKGKKIRVTGSPTMMVKNLGGLPVTLTAGEQYTALQRGTVDGTLYAIYGLETSSLHEVVDYLILPPIGVNSHSLTCNLDVYNKLPKDLQKVVDEAAIEATYYYKQEYSAFEKTNVDTALKEHGIKLIELPMEEITKLRQASISIWDDAAAKTPRCGILVDMIKSYLKEKGL